MRNISGNLRTPPIPQGVAGEYFTLCFNCVLVNLLLPVHVQNEWNNIVLTLSPLDVFIKLMIISLNSKARSFANTNVQPIIMILHITHSEPVEWLCRFVNWNFGKYSRIMSSAQHIQWYESECVRLYKLAAIQFCSANNCYLFVGTLKKFPIHLHGASCMPYSHSLTEYMIKLNYIIRMCARRAVRGLSEKWVENHEKCLKSEFPLPFSLSIGIWEFKNVHMPITFQVVFQHHAMQ